MSAVAKQDVVVHDDAVGVDRMIRAGQPIPPELVDAYTKAAGDPDERADTPVSAVRSLADREPVIATKDVVVHDDQVGIDRQVRAGQPVPVDLLDAYAAETGEKIPAAAEAAATKSLDDMNVEELQAEADRRGLTVEGTGKDGNVVKADLVKALSA